MNINFHYFAVKTLAIYAGFNEEDSQTIAGYSQFVDDYTVWMNYWFKNVPEYARSLAEPGTIFYSFYTVTTGFDNVFDNARLAIPKYQREVVVPFHFIPIKRLKDFDEGEGRDQYRTSRADITGTFLIKDLLDDAKEKFQNPNINEREKKMSKIRVGLLLHIFADTYAHENFSGFHGWENFSYLSRVTDNYENDKDITNDYNRDFYYGIYSIGHANVGHAPDDTFVSLDIKMSENSTQRDKEDYTLTFSRSNTQVFCDAAKQIFRYLCSLNGKEENEFEAIWRDVHEYIKRGFKCHSTEANELVAKWREICPNINYHYDKKDYWDNQLVPLLFDENVTLEEKLEQTNIAGIYKTAQDDFFYYNLVAKEIRDKIIE